MGDKPYLPRTLRKHLQPPQPCPRHHPVVNILVTRLRILAVSEGDPNVIVSDGIEYTQVLTHAHEAVRWKSVKETLPKGGRLRRARGQERRSYPPHPSCQRIPCRAPTAPSPAVQANPEQALLHVWPVLMSRSFDALLHGLGQLPQLLDLPEVLICLLALLLGGGRRVQGWGAMSENTP